MKDRLIKFYHWSNTWTGTIVIVLLVIFFVAQAFVIPSGSMKNTLLIGDHLFVKKFAYGIPTPHIPWLEIPVLPDFDKDGHIIAGDKPKRGDIVIFRYPVNEKIHYVKRCVAVGGDYLFIHNKDLYLHPHEGNEFILKNYPKKSIVEINGLLWVKNPYQKDHPGIHHDPNVINDGRYPQEIFNFGPIEVPKDEFFMMGDNRDHSNDSRFWGSVPYRLIVGKPWFIYFSWDKNYEIRWDRMGKSVKQIEEEMKKSLDISH
ncbi:signal peptidase I [Nitrosophilus kaiyonis]|uniref:signal peptidase I n=1 Tax=Nitrosophilus kaiyonis TaxID=2930200 RepID=UPI0024911F78|nr:signal peptidase I [Nitrosophilus kaiyonis]